MIKEEKTISHEISTHSAHDLVGFAASDHIFGPDLVVYLMGNQQLSPRRLVVKLQGTPIFGVFFGHNDIAKKLVSKRSSNIVHGIEQYVITN